VAFFLCLGFLYETKLYSARRHLLAQPISCGFCANQWRLLPVSRPIRTITSSNPISTNNVVSVPVTFQIHLPDLGPVAFQAPRFVAGPPNSTFTVTWGVTNRGLAPVVSDLNGTTTFISRPTPRWVIPPTHLDRGRDNVVPAGGVTGAPCVAPTLVPSGSYFLLFAVNNASFVEESDYGNNLIVTPITLSVRPPDLATIAWLVRRA